MADLRVIDAGGPEKEERVRQRDREWSKDEFSWAIRETAANMAPDLPWRGQTERIARSDEENDRQRDQISSAPQSLAGN